MNEVLSGYLRGQLLIGLTMGAMAWVGSYLLGVAYPLAIGVLAGVFALIPMFGPWLASLPAITDALIAPHPWPLVLWTALYFLGIQQVESNVIGPRITGNAVGLHPLAVLLALLVGSQLDGILGAILAVPVTGMLYRLTAATYRSTRGRSGREGAQSDS